MNKRAALVTAGVTAALALAPMTSAQAAAKPQINASGLGTYTIVGGDVASSSVRKLRGGDGWLEVRLSVDGRAGITAYDS